MPGDAAHVLCYHVDAAVRHDAADVAVARECLVVTVSVDGLVIADHTYTRAVLCVGRVTLAFGHGGLLLDLTEAEKLLNARYDVCHTLPLPSSRAKTAHRWTAYRCLLTRHANHVHYVVVRGLWEHEQFMLYICQIGQRSVMKDLLGLVHHCRRDSATHLVPHRRIFSHWQSLTAQLLDEG